MSSSMFFQLCSEIEERFRCVKRLRTALVEDDHEVAIIDPFSVIKISQKPAFPESPPQPPGCIISDTTVICTKTAVTHYGMHYSILKKISRSKKLKVL